MNVSALPPVRHVLPMTTIRRERTLPVPGTILARVNERVQALDIVAEADLPKKHIYLDLARGLGIPLKQIGAHIHKEPGAIVEAGDVIAGPVGMARRAVRAPGAGRIISIKRGRALLQLSGEPYQLRAGFPGVVAASDGYQNLVIETTGALIEGLWGNGRQEYGVMRYVGSGPSSRLTPDALNLDVRGAVVVAGICDEIGTLRQLKDLNVRGVIVGGLSSQLIAFSKHLPFPVIVLEGFGPLPFNEPVFELLRTNSGREAAIDARYSGVFGDQRPEVIISQPAMRRLDLPAEIVPLGPGVRVHIVRPPHRGAVGIVQDVPRGAVALPSGILVNCARVELAGIGVVSVPQANLEILQ